ncbi:MAG TPA: gluconate 2-dehydrogenase subunit 3 family protein [Longimicrobiales bacterium]|nr:gluconate 2-dehydrogenase subunit 3 family protein [Longimicrobiales bacterium]
MNPAAASASAVLRPVRATFRAVAKTVVPDMAALDEAAWTRVEAIVERALADRPARMRRQLVVYMRLIDGLALARHGRRFRSLEADARQRLLERLQDSRVLLLRRGFWGLRTLVYMGWYAQPSTAEAIGYGAAKGGWAARPGLTPATPLPDVVPAHELVSRPEPGRPT